MFTEEYLAIGESVRVGRIRIRVLAIDNDRVTLAVETQAQLYRRVRKMLLPISSGRGAVIPDSQPDDDEPRSAGGSN